MSIIKLICGALQVTEGGGWRNVKGQWSRHQQGSASDPLEDSAFLGGATTSESNAASEGLSLTDLSHNGQRQGKATQRDTQMAPQSLEEGSNVEDARELRRQLSDLKEQLSSERKVSERLTKQLAVARMMLYAQVRPTRSTDVRSTRSNLRSIRATTARFMVFHHTGDAAPQTTLI